MRHCLPDELFNRVPYPVDGHETTGIDGICREIHYKLPGAEDVAVMREVWHTLCDFCVRLGAWQERIANDGGAQVQVSTQYGKFQRIVGAEANGVRTTDFEIVEGDGAIFVNFTGEDVASCAVYVSVRPAFDDKTADAYGEWHARVPQYFIDRYGECIAHGALARLYAMRGEGEMARMHATAYNNDLNRLAFGLVTAGMRKHLLIDVEDWLVSTNGNG